MGNNKSKIDELSHQVESLTAVNKALEQRISEIVRREIAIGKKESPSNSSAVSERNINLFVEKLLQDPNINIKYLPDYVERQLYRNVFTIMLGIINQTLDSTEIHMMGHKITIQMTPDDPIEKSIEKP